VRQTAKVRFDPRPVAATTSLSGIRVRVGTTLELPPGRYQIRVAAGTTLTAGNIVYDLKVPDFSEGPLAMSGIALVNRAKAASWSCTRRAAVKARSRRSAGARIARPRRRRSRRRVR
jgi:hypothetical protein